MTERPHILVAGAGPTGLALALQAHDHGARVRIVDRRPHAFRPSRALIVHPRTLEALRPLGVVEQLLEAADTAPAARLRLGGRTVEVSLGDLALADTEFPHLTLVRQSDVEAVLTHALAERGVPVEWGTELVAARNAPRYASVRLRSDAGLHESDVRFVAGCDGQQSTVRASAGISWKGSPYRQEILLADLDLDLDGMGPGPQDGVARIGVDSAGLAFLFPLGEQAQWRLLATRDGTGDYLPFGGFGPAIPEERLQHLLDATGLDAHITHLAWSARVGVQHRLATRFRRGSLFLAGDAAHAYSPAAGQGMNSGIQDALNLGWKLAFAARAESVSGTATLLDSYELERRPVALRRLLLTHMVFWAESSTAPLPSWLRRVAAPAAAQFSPLLLRRRQLVAFAVRYLSQMRIRYRGSPLSVQTPTAPRDSLRAGDRVPDTAIIADGRPTRMHDLLASPGVHLLVQRGAPRVVDGQFGPHVSVHTLDRVPGGGSLAVRPDGYAGFRCSGFDTEALERWLALIVPSGSADPC